MSPPLLLGLLLTASYLLGSVPFGYLVARWRGVDIFKEGSGNIGATNVGRVLGRRYGLLVFALDFAKGALPVAAARLLVPDESGLPPDVAAAAAGLAAFLGHLFPIYLRFRGGKGVATGAGVVAVLLPGPALAGLVVWLAVLGATRTVSLASILAAVALCVCRLTLTPAPFAADHVLLTCFALLATGLVIVRHRANVGRLLRGTENRLKDTPAMLLFTKTVHVLTLGLWFGMVIFFTFIVGLALFDTFWALGEQEASARPLWFPLTPEFDRDPSAWNRPDGSTPQAPFTDARSIRREQGGRAAGHAVSPLFDWYFLLQGVCGFLATAMALGWPKQEPGRFVHKLRVTVLLLALVTVLGGWPLEHKVSELRAARGEKVDAVLRSAQPSPEEVSQAAALARDFGRWHTYSLFLNFGTALLVTAAMALAARLPQENEPLAA